MSTASVFWTAVVIAVGGTHVGPLRPLGHLLLLLTAVRALTVEDRKSFLRALVPVMLVWVVAVASSTHISLVAYLLASAVVWWWAGMRIHMDGLPGLERTAAAGLPRPGHVAVAGVLTVLLAVPVFVAVPRLRSPWVAAGAGIKTVSGFSEMVELQGWKRVEESQEVALVMRAVDGEPVRDRWTRLRGTALDLLLAGTWAPRRTGLSPPPDRDGLVWLDPDHDSLEGTTRLALEMRVPARYLFLPEGTVAVRSPVPLLRDPNGGLVVEGDERLGLSYTVWAADRDRVRRAAPEQRDLRLPVFNRQVRALAWEVAADADTPSARAAAVEGFLQSRYGYSQTVSAGNRRDPIAWFLFQSGAGHCEFFAGAMVVMLRHLNVPARMVAGYNGGSVDAGGDTLLVRQANAHTWVEAWGGPGVGWQVFDPTPVRAVPGLERMDAMDRVSAAWERLQAAWDRYVLTFGLGEQLGLARALADAAGTVVGWAASPHLPVVLALLLVAAALAWAALGRSRRSPSRTAARRGPAARTMERLARSLRRHDVPVAAGATVRRIGRLARERWPAAAGAVGELVWLAERELYAAAGERQPAGAVRRLWGRIRRAMRS